MRWKTWTPWTAHRAGQASWVLNPILFWTDEDVWRYTRQEGVPYCSLYDEGFTRLGCIGCPMSCRRAKDFARWPGYEKAWTSAAWKYWERRKEFVMHDGRKFSERFPTPEMHWRWWMEELPEPDEDDCQMGLF